jgi:hypothetical protein
MSGVACEGPEGAIDGALAAVVAADLDGAELALGAAATAFACGEPIAPETLARFWLVEGAIRYFEHERDAAREAFAAALRADADTWIDSLGKTLRAERDVASHEMLPTSPVTVSGVPKGYELWTDGARGAPVLDLPVGPHLIQVTRGGLVMDARFFHVYAKEAQVVGFALPDPSAVSTPVRTPGERPPLLAVGGGAWINFGGSFMTQPPDNKDGDGVVLPYNGFAGFSPGFAVGGDVLWRGILSFETDLLFNHDVGISEFTFDGVSYRWRLRQWALHVPLLFKVGPPTGPARPWLAIGNELVFPFKPSVSTPTFPEPTALSAEAGFYDCWTAGIGMDLLVPVNGLDLRVPITFARASYNPSVPLSAFDRATYDVRGPDSVAIRYVSEWEIHASIAFGGWVHRTVAP